MELRHIYMMADMVNDKIKDKSFPTNAKKDIEIHVTVSQPTFYGIDKQLYFETHNNSYEGFEHTGTMINACIDGVNFKITPKTQSEQNT